MRQGNAGQATFPDSHVHNHREMSVLTWDHNAYYHGLLVRSLPRPCERVLDVGCGAGALAAELATRADRVDALDRSPAMIELARGTVPPTSRASCRSWWTRHLLLARSARQRPRCCPESACDACCSGATSCYGTSLDPGARKLAFSQCRSCPRPLILESGPDTRPCCRRAPGAVARQAQAPC
jgi:SAM-dependent methyltransferase